MSDVESAFREANGTSLSFEKIMGMIAEANKVLREILLANGKAFQQLQHSAIQYSQKLDELLKLNEDPELHMVLGEIKSMFQELKSQIEFATQKAVPSSPFAHNFDLLERANDDHDFFQRILTFIKHTRRLSTSNKE